MIRFVVAATPLALDYAAFDAADLMTLVAASDTPLMSASPPFSRCQRRC